MKDIRFVKIRNTLWIALFLNVFVAALKIFYGYYTNTISMAADGYHSLSDGASSFVGIILIYFAAKPVDDGHPYGHKKYETLATLIISFLLVITCYNILEEGIKRFFHQSPPTVTSASFWIMVSTTAINCGLMAYEYIKGKRLGSDLLVSDALHTTSDIFVSLSVIATLFGIRYGYAFLDVVTAVIIAGFIGYAAFRILRASSRVIVDATVIDPEKIKNEVMAIDGIKFCHMIRSRGREDDINVDLHIHVDKNMTVESTHNLSHLIEKRLKEKFAGVTGVIVHIEPYMGA